MATFDRKEDYNYLRWSAEVKKIANYMCEICGRRGIELNSHHMNSWDVFIDERYIISNGACICKDHHELFHEIYGKGNNTELQFEEFRMLCEIVEKEKHSYASVEKLVEEVNQKLINDGYC